MKPHFLSTQISFADFRHSVEDYPQQVPEKVQGLEELRYYEIPEALAQRRKAGEAFLEKTELKSLVEWKLYVVARLHSHQQHSKPPHLL